MKKNNIIIFSLIIILTMGILFTDYIKQLGTILADASVPNPGHPLIEIEGGENLATKSYVDDALVGITGSNWTVSGSNIYRSDGNVGIGVSDPESKLDVSGGIRISSSAATCNSNAVGMIKYESSVGDFFFCNGYNWAALINWSNNYLYNNVHTIRDCENLDGEGVFVEGVYFCKLDLASCPSGWSQYQSWTAWAAREPACIPSGYAIDACSSGVGLIYPDSSGYYDPPGRDLPALEFGNHTEVSNPRTGTASFRLWSSNCYNWDPGPYSCNYSDSPVQVGCY